MFPLKNKHMTLCTNSIIADNTLLWNNSFICASSSTVIPQASTMFCHIGLWLAHIQCPINLHRINEWMNMSYQQNSTIFPKCLSLFLMNLNICFIFTPFPSVSVGTTPSKTKEIAAPLNTFYENFQSGCICNSILFVIDTIFWGKHTSLFSI